MRALAAAVVAALLMVLAPASASAEDVPPYDGAMSFPAIQGPEDPEEFSWQVQLGEDEELRAIDDRHAGVYYVGEGEEMRTMTIVAQAAHDAEGKAVPTTLAVTQPNVITLTVHHRAGDPAAGGSPFDYPVVAGVGWEGGFQTHIVVMPPSETAPPVMIDPSPRCVVPDLSGLTVKAARRQLRKARCKLGPVRGERARGAKVVRQYRKAGKSLPAGAEVGVKVVKAARSIPAAG
jgi:hypothetical protein